MQPREIWIVRVEHKGKDYLTVHSKHEKFPSEKRAWKYVERMQQKFPQYTYYVGKLQDAGSYQMSLDLNKEELDF